MACLTPFALILLDFWVVWVFVTLVAAIARRVKNAFHEMHSASIDGVLAINAGEISALISQRLRFDLS